MLRRVPFQAVLLIVLTGVIVLLAGCGSAEDDPKTTIDPAGSAADIIQNIYVLVFVLSVVVFVLVEGALIFALIKFRGRSRSGHGRPAPVHGNTKLEVIWTVIPALILVIIAIPTLRGIADLADQPEDAMPVTVIAQQFFFQFEFPEQDLVVANEMHIPINTKIDITLMSNDVIHSFWVPQLAGKTDAIPVLPGEENKMWLEGEKLGTYLGQCAEFCGLGHAHMTFTVVVDTEEDFLNWVEEQKAAPEDPAQAGMDVFMSKCTACHTIDGTAAQGTVGPNLTHFASRPTIAGVLPNTPDDLRAWLTDPPAEKPGTAMPNYNLPPEEIDWLIAYLNTLE